MKHIHTPTPRTFGRIFNENLNGLLSVYHFPPQKMGNSNELFPSADLARKSVLNTRANARRCAYRPYLPWQEVQHRLLALRELL
jgi:hypothetical protein